MIRVIIYARVSTEDQVEKYGLPLQFRSCREYAAANQWQVVAEIADEGVSGTILDRPGLLRVRHMAAAGECDVVLMVDVDRLSRELAHLLILKPEIEKRAALAFVNAKFEDSPSGRLFFGMRGVIAQYEREQMRARMMGGKRERALSGLIVGGRIPYGYRYAEGRLEPVEPAAGVVRQIYSWFLNGQAIRAITRRLRAEGSPTSRGGRWGHSSVQRILVNETYAGLAHYGTWKREGAVLRRRDPESRIPLTVPALVSREQWDAVQRRLAENPQVGRPSSAFLLRGILHCGACGRKMHGERGRSNSYRCSGRDGDRHTGELCRSHVGALKADAAVWGAIAAAMTDAPTLRGLLAQYQTDLQVEARPERVDGMQRQLRAAQAKEAHCLVLLTDPELAGVVAVKQQYLAAQRERVKLDEDLARVASLRRQAQSAGAWLEEQISVLREYVPSLQSVEQRQGFLRGLVKRAEWTGQEVRMHCLFAQELTTTSAHCGQFADLSFVVVAGVA